MLMPEARANLAVRVLMLALVPGRDLRALTEPRSHFNLRLAVLALTVMALPLLICAYYLHLVSAYTINLLFQWVVLGAAMAIASSPIVLFSRRTPPPDPPDDGGSDPEVHPPGPRPQRGRRPRRRPQPRPSLVCGPRLHRGQAPKRPVRDLGRRSRTRLV